MTLERTRRRPPARIVGGALYVAAMVVVAAVAAWPIYRSGGSCSSWRRPRSPEPRSRPHRDLGLAGSVTTLVAAGSTIVLGVLVAVPARWSDPAQAARALVDVLLGVVTGWKDLVTVELPVGSYRNLLVPALVVFLVGTLLALRFAWERGRVSSAAAVVCLAMVFFGLAFGRPVTSEPARIGPWVLPAPWRRSSAHPPCSAPSAGWRGARTRSAGRRCTGPLTRPESGCRAGDGPPTRGAHSSPAGWSRSPSERPPSPARWRPRVRPAKCSARAPAPSWCSRGPRAPSPSTARISPARRSTRCCSACSPSAHRPSASASRRSPPTTANCSALSMSPRARPMPASPGCRRRSPPSPGSPSAHASRSTGSPASGCPRRDSSRGRLRGADADALADGFYYNRRTAGAVQISDDGVNAGDTYTVEAVAPPFPSSRTSPRLAWRAVPQSLREPGDVARRAERHGRRQGSRAGDLPPPRARIPEPLPPRPRRRRPARLGERARRLRVPAQRGRPLPGSRRCPLPAAAGTAGGCRVRRIRCVAGRGGGG